MGEVQLTGLVDAWAAWLARLLGAWNGSLELKARI